MDKSNKGKTAWRVFGYVLVVLTILLALGAVNNLASGFSGSDPAENIGKVIGAILLPVVVGFLSRSCFRKSKR
jgi:predicted Na+-dependent transporter